MDFCPNCGATIDTAQNFCPNCGYPLTGKAQKMVMGVTQKMLLMPPQSDNAANNNSTNQILDKPYVPNTRAHQDNTVGQRLNNADDPYLQNNDQTQNFNNQEPLSKGYYGDAAALPEASPADDYTHPTANQAPHKTTPSTLNNYVTRSAYEQLSSDPVSYNAPFTDGQPADNNAGSDNGLGDRFGSQAAFAAPQDNSSYGDNSFNMPNNMPAANTGGSGDYGNQNQYHEDAMGYDANGGFDNGNNGQSGANPYYGTAGYANDEAAANQANAGNYSTDAYNQNGYQNQPDNYGQGATAAAGNLNDGYGNSYGMNQPATGQNAYMADNGGYATQPMGYGQDQNDYNDSADDDYDDDRDAADNRSFFQKISVMDWITAALSLILILTNFVGGFISSGSFGAKGATSATLYKTMTLGGPTFKMTMILLLVMLIIGPLALLVFSIVKIHAAYIIKLAASVVSILAYIAAFGIMISKGVVAASGLQNFQFGIAAIVAIVILIANFILSVVDFVKY